MAPAETEIVKLESAFWHRLVLVLFLLFQYGDVVFGSRSLNTLGASPANFPIGVKEASGWLSGSALDRFNPGVIADRALWDRPLVYDPNLHAAGSEIWRGEFPLRNRYLGLGLPLFANGVDMSLTIPGLLMSALDSASWDFVYLGMYLLSLLLIFESLRRYFDNSNTASLVATIVVSASGLFVPQLSFGGEIINIHAAILGFFAIEAMIRPDRVRPWCIALLILALTQAAYAGMPEGTVATFCMLGGYAFIRFLCRYRLTQVLALCTWIFTVALLLSAPYLGLLFYYSTLMTHAHEVGHLQLPATLIPDIFLPYLRGWTFDRFFLERYPNRLNVVFVGVTPLLVLALGLTVRDRLTPNFSARAWCFIGVIVFYLTQAFGTAGFSLNFVGSLPVLKQVFFFRFFSPIFVLSVALLTAHILTKLERTQASRFSLIGPIVISSLTLAYLTVQRLLTEEVASLQNQDEVINTFLAWNRPNSWSVYGAFGVVLLTFIFRLRPRSIGIIVLIFAVASSNYHFSKSFYPRTEAFPKLGVTQFLHRETQRSGPARIYSSQQLFPGTASGYEVEDIRHMNPVVPRDTIAALLGLFGKFAEGTVSWERFETLNDPADRSLYNHPAFDLLNVRYFIFPAWSTALPTGHRFPEVYRDSTDVVIRNRGALKRIFLVDDWELLDKDTPLNSWVENNLHRLTKVAPVREEPTWFKGQLGKLHAGRDSIKLVQTRNSDYLVDVALSEPRLVVLSDGYIPGWRAEGDGEELNVLKAYDGLVAVAAPAGEYQLTITYRPPVWGAIWICFGAGVGILIFTSLFIALGSRKQDALGTI